jgi:hypothetical protein
MVTTSACIKVLIREDDSATGLSPNRRFEARSNQIKLRSRDATSGTAPSRDATPVTIEFSVENKCKAEVAMRSII